MATDVNIPTAIYPATIRTTSVAKVSAAANYRRYTTYPTLYVCVEDTTNWRNYKLSGINGGGIAPNTICSGRKTDINATN